MVPGPVLTRADVGAGTVAQFRLLHAGDAETGQVVFARRVHVGHFRRLTADQRATGQLAALGNAADHGHHRIHVQLAGGEVVQEEQRLCTLHQHVVDAHAD